MLGHIKHFAKFVLIWCKYRKVLRFFYTTNLSLGNTYEGANKIYWHTYFLGSLGYGSYIGPNSEITANIGRFSSIAPYVRTNLGVHPYTYPFVTTCPMFFSTQKQNGISFANRIVFTEFTSPTTIGNDVWVGENVFIGGGLTIGDGAVVLAGAVVMKDVPPYAIVGGVPAKVIKYRYDKETIDFLLNVKWWDMDVEWLQENWELLCDIDRLKKWYNDKM